MNLRDALKNTLKKEDDTIIQQVVSTYEKNEMLYKDKSITWKVRVTADELNMKKDQLIDILEKYYEGAPNAGPQ